MIATSLRTSLRQYRRHPFYAVSCALTLALAVGAGTGSFAVVRQALLQPLPYDGGDRIMALYTHTQTWEDSPVSVHVMQDLQSSDVALADIVAIDPEGVGLSTADGIRRVIGLQVTSSFFQLFTPPAAGRAWREGENGVVVLTWEFWQRQFAGDPRVLDSSVAIDGEPHIVVGIMPESFVPPFWTNAEMLRPVDVAGLLASEPRARRSLSLFARAPEGVTAAQLDAQLATFSSRLQQQYPSDHGDQHWWVEPLRKSLVGEAGPVLLGVSAAAILLMLIVCANIAGVSAARAVALRPQLAVQGALGATRGRLLAERVIEVALIGVAGSAAGVWVGYALFRAISVFQPQFLDRISVLRIDPATLLAGFLVGLVCCTVAGSLPFLTLLRRRLDAPGSVRGSTGTSTLTALRSSLVVMQVAVALVLIVGAGLLVRTVRHLSERSLGFSSERMTTMFVAMPPARYATEDAQVMLERELLERLRAMPQVADATASVGIPVIGGTRASLHIRGSTSEVPGEVAYFSIAPGFLEVLDIDVHEGRDIAATDVDGAPGAILVNETMARMYWPSGDAVGARIYLGPGGAPDESSWMTVVGIVADVRQHGPVADVLPTAYGSTHQYSWPSRYLTFRLRPGATPPTELELQRIAHQVDPAVAISNVSTIDDLVADETAPQRLVMLALVFFGIVATSLCAFGLYAVVSLTSQLRRREYAIRLAVGAQPAGVRWLVVRQALLLGVTGTLAGLLLAGAGTRALQGLLHGVDPLDAGTFMLAAVMLLLLAVLAAVSPARQAGRVAAVEILKAE